VGSTPGRCWGGDGSDNSRCRPSDHRAGALQDHPAPRRLGQGRSWPVSRAPSARRPARVERRETPLGRLQPARQLVLEPLDPGARSQQLVRDVRLARAVMLVGGQPGGLDRNAALRTCAIAIHGCFLYPLSADRYARRRQPIGGRVPRRGRRQTSSSTASRVGVGVPAGIGLGRSRKRRHDKSRLRGIDARTRGVSRARSGEPCTSSAIAARFRPPVRAGRQERVEGQFMARRPDTGSLRCLRRGSVPFCVPQPLFLALQSQSTAES
jgi:hypothetical protein